MIILIICLIVSVLSMCVSCCITFFLVWDIFQSEWSGDKFDPFAGISFVVRLTKADYENMRCGSNNREIRKENKTGDNRKSIN